VCCADPELEEARLDLSAPRTGVLRPERAHADPAATRPPAGGALPRASTAAAVGADEADDAAALAALAAEFDREFASLSAGEGGAADDTLPAAGGGAPRAAAHAMRAGEEAEAPAQRGASGEGTGGDAGGARVGGADHAAGEHAAVQWEMEQTPEAVAVKVRVPRRPGVAAALPRICAWCPRVVRAPPRPGPCGRRARGWLSPALARAQVWVDAGSMQELDVEISERCAATPPPPRRGLRAQLRALTPAPRGLLRAAAHGAPLCRRLVAVSRAGAGGGVLVRAELPVAVDAGSARAAYSRKRRVLTVTAARAAAAPE